MTRNERRILSEAIRSVVHHDNNLWWELKRQIFDWGYQSHYPREYDYDSVAKAAITNLSPERKLRLHQEWPRWRKISAPANDETLLKIYTPIIIEEVVRRASVAAGRTEHW